MLLVGKLVNYAASGGVANTALTPNLLDAGAIGIYGMQTGDYRETLITSGASAAGKTQASTFTGKSIRIIEGLGAGLFKVSETLDVKGISQLNPNAYAAPVAWKAYIGNNGTSGSVVIGTLSATRNEAIVKIRERYSNREKGMPYYYDILIDPTGETAATILAKIKAALDDGRGNPSLFTTVINGGNTGLSLTALDATKSYDISIEGVIETSTVTVVGEAPGSGRYAQLRGYEKLSQAKRGYFDTLSTEVKSPATSLVDGTLYDFYVVGAVNSQIPGGFGGAGLAGNANVETSVEVKVAFTNGGVSTAGGNQIEFESIMKSLTGKTFTTLTEAP